MAIKEYKTIKEVVGPLMLVQKTKDVTYDELVKIKLANGEERLGKVLEVNKDEALVQLFESSQGLKIEDAKAVISVITPPPMPQIAPATEATKHTIKYNEDRIMSILNTSKNLHLHYHIEKQQFFALAYPNCNTEKLQP